MIGRKKNTADEHNRPSEPAPGAYLLKGNLLAGNFAAIAGIILSLWEWGWFSGD